MIWMLLACSSTPPAPATPTPDADATRSAVDALCKLFEGADMDCKRAPAGILVDGRTFGVDASTTYEVSTGMATVRGLVKLESAKQTYTTRLRGFGSGKKDALERGLHEWALVSGTAVVDAWVNPDARHALKAVEPTAEPLTYSGGRVLRGWTYFQPKGVLEHAPLLEAIGPAAGDGAQGVLTLEVTRQSGDVTVDCFWEGAPNEAICEKARAWSWPGGTWELRTSYVFLGS